MMNRTMKLLLLSDIFVLTGFGLIQPILAIYISGGVTGGTMLSAGLASALFLFTKSMVQLPFGHYVDRQPGKTKWLILGTLLMAGVPIIYITANSIYHIYMAEIIYGLGSGLAYPTWLGLWSANLDKGRESFQWSVYSTSTGLGTAATGAAGAAVASVVGFNATFIMAGLLCMLGCMALIILERRGARKAGDLGGVRPVSVEGMAELADDSLADLKIEERLDDLPRPVASWSDAPGHSAGGPQADSRQSEKVGNLSLPASALSSLQLNDTIFS